MEKTTKKKMPLTAKILIGLLSGIVVGLILNAVGLADIANNVIKPFGTLFLNLIKMAIVPLVFASLVMGACGLGDVKKVGRIGGKTIVYFLCTTALAVVIGLIIGKLFNVGAGMTLPSDAVYEAKEATGFVDTLLNIIPTNPFKALVEGNMLQVIAFALFVGVGIAIVGPKAESFKQGMEGFAEVMYSIIGGIMQLAPYAVFCLIIPVVASQGAGVLAPLAMLIIAVYLACILHAVITYSITVKAGKRDFDTQSILSLLKRLNSQGAECFILGCTELPLAFADYHIPGETIDPGMALARAALLAAGAEIRQ